MTKSWVFAVNFERPESGPPVTIRGTVAAGHAATAASRAIKAALAESKGIRYESCVIVLSRPQAPRIVDTVAAAGAKGGRARAAALSADELSEQGRRAAAARWGKEPA